MGSEGASARKENESELGLTFCQHTRTHIPRTRAHTHTQSFLVAVQNSAPHFISFSLLPPI